LWKKFEGVWEIFERVWEKFENCGKKWENCGGEKTSFATLKCQDSFIFGREIERTIFRFGAWPDSAQNCIDSA
jgi:hypothetical protein